MATRLWLTVLSLTFLGCFEGPHVTQGVVVEVDVTARVLVVRDERAPHGEIPFWFGSAEVGTEPLVGDVVRLAWKERDNRRVVTRVMNLSRPEN